MADGTRETCEANSFPESKEVKYDVGNMKRQISTSDMDRFCVFKDSSKSHDADAQSSDGRSAAVKSDISTEFGSGCFEMDAKKTHHNITAVEDGLNTMTHDSQQRTESSCSNSLPILLPVSFSNHSYQEASKEAHSFRNCGGPADSFCSKAFDHGPEEPVTAVSSESGASAQIAREAIRNARAKNSIKISLNHTKKGDEEITDEWGHTTMALQDEVSEQTDAYKWTPQNVSSDSFNCTSKTSENVRSCDEHDELPTSHSESLMKKLGKVSVKNEDEFIAGFDLNEDITANEMDDSIEPVNGTVSSHCVIHVVAKTGIPIGQPVIPLKFEGGLGWKGSAKTSAFCPAALSNCVDRKTRSSNQIRNEPQGFTGIDLNVAAIEDSSDLPMEHEGISVDSKRAKSLLIDLNCLCDADDELNQRSVLPASENPPLIDLNVSTSPEVKSNKTSDSENLMKRDFDFTGRDRLACLNMQRVANNADNLHIFQSVELIQTAAPLQPNSPFISHTRFHLPYTRYSQEHSIFPEVLNPGTVNASFVTTPHLVQRRNLKVEDNLSTSGSKMDDARQHPFLAKNSTIGEHMQQEAWYRTTMKRKEPEGGLECYQPNYKQVT